MNKEELKHGLLGWLDTSLKTRTLLIGAAGLSYLPYDAIVDICEDPMQIKGTYSQIIALDLHLGRDERLALFKQLRKHIDPDGQIYVGFANRNGVRYLCGAYDVDVKEPFTYMDSSLPDRRQLEAELREAGYEDVYFYYPCYDQRFAQVIYSDELLPSRFEDDRIMVCEENDELLLADPRKVFASVCEDGLLSERANYFLVNASVNKLNKERIRKIIASPDRDKEESFFLCFYEDKVIKKPACRVGGAILSRQYTNLRELHYKGIPTVDAVYEDDTLTMPYIKHDTLLEQIRKRHDDRPFIEEIFDKLYQDILRSSWHVQDEAGKQILAKGYIDMVPFNCFLIDGKPVYFDQEFTMEDCPVTYIMFRAIYYTYIHVPALEQTITSHDLYEKYGISKQLYHYYKEKEGRFVSRLRNHSELEDIYDGLIDPDKIKEKRERFLRQMKDPYGLNRVHEVQLQLLKTLIAICERHGLNYYAIHGTLLGAVRHKGFIPWDDDVDIAMPRQDFEKLIAVAKDELPEHYFLQTMENDPGCFYGGYAKLRDSSTSAIEKIHLDRDCNQGIYIDIFPLDFTYEDETQRHRQQKKITLIQRLIYAKKYQARDGILADVPSEKISRYYRLRRLVSIKTLYRRLRELFLEVKDSSKLAILACYYGLYGENIYDRELFEGTQERDFEDIRIKIPSGYERILRERYGDDYLKIPKQIQNSNEMIFDADTDYISKKEQMTNGKKL